MNLKPLLDNLEDVEIFDVDDHFRHIGNLHELLKKVSDLAPQLTDLLRLIRDPKERKYVVKMINAIVFMRDYLEEC